MGSQLGVGFALVLLATTCDAPATRPGASAQPPSPPGPREYDPKAVLEPEPAVASVREGAGPEERYARAVEALGRDPEPALRGRLQWLAGRAALERTDWGAARRHFDALGDSDHLLAPWATLVLAEGLASTDPGASATYAARLTGEDWAGRDRARRVEARSLALAGDSERALAKLRELLAEEPEASAATAITRPLAELLAQSEDPAAREEAVQLYRRIEAHAPSSSAATTATEAIEAILSTLPPERAAALREPTVAEATARARSLYDTMESERAVAAYEALVERIEDGPERCEARLMLGRALLRDRSERARGAAHMESVANDCEQPAQRGAALYNAARAYGRLGRHEDAERLYDRVEATLPNDTLADDARFRAALAALERGNEDAFTERMETLPDRYPNGDMRGDARFMLAWRARRAAANHPEGDATRAEHLRVALRQLEASIQEGPLETAEDIRGRAAYWRARTLGDLGDRTAAVAGYRALVQEWPLSYYSQQSLARLDELDREVAASLRENMGGGDTPQSSEPLTFAWRSELDSTAFRRALDLFRVEETEMALLELGHLGALGEGADPDMLWLVAATLDAAGEHPRASRLVRTRLQSFMRTAPTGRARLLWRLAYPKAFHPLIEEVAAAEGVPPAFVRAIAREESAFDPGAVSVARAYGLIQLIEPTAQRFARQLGMASVSPAQLTDPATNLRIGTRFIAYLRERFAGNVAVVPAGYNAGEGAVDRWLRERGSLPLDAFIEEIPYDETRRYTRRVLQTYGVYAWLDTQALPLLPATLP